MQQTSKYQFNLVEGSDDFSPTPLNQNMEKVEEALEELEGAVETAQEAADITHCASGTFSIPYPSTVGTVVHTLNFVPDHLVISSADMAIIRQGGTGSVHLTTAFGSSDYYITLKLSGSQITYQGSGPDITSAVSITYCAYQ